MSTPKHDWLELEIMAQKNPQFTERLKKVVHDYGTKKSFALKAKIGVSTLGNYFAKKYYGRVAEWDQLVKISQASGKSIEWFLTGKDPNMKGDAEGGKSMEVEALRIACKLLQEKVERLEAELFRLTTGTYDRRKSGEGT